MSDNIRLGARLRAARKAAGFKTSKEFIKKYKIPASTYSQHESGSRAVDDETVRYYSELFGVNLSWLKTGTGNPYKLISSAKKNIMTEELLDIRQAKPLPINEKILNKVLYTIIGINKLNIPGKMLRSIIKDTLEMYSKVVNSSSPLENALKQEIKHYEKTIHKR